MFSFKERPDIVSILKTYSFDVLVIGGGIMGAGIALDAASRGLSVALVEMQDFSAGTSSRSTKLVHGGLRYLKQLDFGLVAEVGKEREIVYENAVHVTSPEWMLLPIYKNGSFGKFTLSIALTIYDKLANVRKSERRKILSKQETLEKVPMLKKEGLVGAGYYVEYKTDDARLTIEVIKKAIEYRAVCLNYARATGFIYHKKKIVGAHVKDEITGEVFTIHANQIVNATGPWIDELRGLDKIEHNKKIRLTKGIHIVVDQSVIPLKQAVYFDSDDGRMIFAIPRDGKTYIGTTDTFYENDPVHVTATEEDIEYLIQKIQLIFPEVIIERKDIESTWAGVRPLIEQKGKNPSEISRKDEIWISSTGLMTIAGGKLTGYRLMAQQIVNKIIKRNGYKHALESMTKNIPLSGAKGLNSNNFIDFVKDKAKEGETIGIPFDQAKKLAEKYGTNVDEVFKYANIIKGSTVQLPTELYAELLYCIYHEMVYTPSDFFIRRTGYLYFQIDLVEKYKEGIIDVMSNILGYSESERQFYTIQLDQMIDDAKISNSVGEKVD